MRAATVESQRSYGEVGNNEISIWKLFKHFKITMYGGAGRVAKGVSSSLFVSRGEHLHILM